jgi:hypothetical protein
MLRWLGRAATRGNRTVAKNKARYRGPAGLARLAVWFGSAEVQMRYAKSGLPTGGRVDPGMVWRTEKEKKIRASANRRVVVPSHRGPLCCRREVRCVATRCLDGDDLPHNGQGTSDMMRPLPSLLSPFPLPPGRPAAVDPGKRRGRWAGERALGLGLGMG